MIITLQTAARIIPASQLKAFHGWFALFAAGVYLAPLPSIVTISKIRGIADENVSTSVSLAFFGEITLVILLLIMQLALAMFLARKSRYISSLLISSGIYISAMTPLYLIWTGMVVSQQTGQSFGDVIEKVTTARIASGWIGATLIVGVWMLYVTRSRRVANTFVH